MLLAHDGRLPIWDLVCNRNICHSGVRDGKKAAESAIRACDLSDRKDAIVLGTLAAAYAEAGDFEKAVQWQEKANKLYTDPEDRTKGEERLKLFKDKKPYRQTD